MFASLIAMIVLVIVLGGALGWTLAALDHEKRKQRIAFRDERIAQLERELDMNLPALQTIPADKHPLAYVLGVIAGLWITERAKGRGRW